MYFSGQVPLYCLLPFLHVSGSFSPLARSLVTAFHTCLALAVSVVPSLGSPLAGSACCSAVLCLPRIPGSWQVPSRFGSRSRFHQPLRSWRMGMPRTRCLGIRLSRSGWCLAAVPCCQVYCTIIVPYSQVLYSYFRYYFHPPHIPKTLDIATLQPFVAICRKVFRYFLKKLLTRNIKKHLCWCFGFGFWLFFRLWLFVQVLDYYVCCLFAYGPLLLFSKLA